MSIADTVTRWLTYPEAARRVNSSERTINRWRLQGMEMHWRVGVDDIRERIVDEETLLIWWRQKMQASPVHQQRMRRIARENGLPDPITPPRQVTPRNGEKSLDPDENSAHSADVISVEAQTRRELLIQAATANALTEGVDEYADLHRALRHETPACAGLTVFTDSGARTSDERAYMESICLRCPVLEQCRAYAAAGNPAAGFWGAG